MTRRLFSWCVLVWCCLPSHPAVAQKANPANRTGSVVYYRVEEHEAAPAPPKAIDGALADLLAKLAGMKPKSGPLDTEGLKKLLHDNLQGLKPPDKLKITSSGTCSVIDPKDVGGYWDGAGMSFTNGPGTEYAWQKRLAIDGKKCALAEPPLVELKYIMVGQWAGDGAVRPFARDLRLGTDYYIVVTVTLKFDPEAMEEGKGGTFSGVGAGNAEPPKFKGMVSLTDHTRL